MQPASVNEIGRDVVEGKFVNFRNFAAADTASTIQTVGPVLPAEGNAYLQNFQKTTLPPLNGPMFAQPENLSQDAKAQGITANPVEGAGFCCCLRY